MRRTGIAVAVVAGLALAVGVGVAVSAQLHTAATQKGIFATMNGAREVNSDGQTGTGDSNGRGAFSATIDGGKLCYGISVANIEKPVAAHIHKAAVGKAGAVVVALKQPGKGDPGASSACTNVESSVANQLRNNPGQFYVNVHTGSLPDGAIRGQLFTSAGK
ncbi:MAG TPA: CHRD domain-containing protein [Thermoleophilaceae bacterium]|nr:CHRD domain-containing protein [Thermoleophilaceae bacterium]